MECAGIYTLGSCSPWPAIPCGQKALPPMPGLQLVQAQGPALLALSPWRFCSTSRPCLPTLQSCPLDKD